MASYIVTIEMLTGKLLPLKLPGTTTMGTLKQQIANQQKIALHNIRLQYKGEDLKDDGQKLEEFAEGKKVSIKLIIRAHGGH